MKTLGQSEVCHFWKNIFCSRGQMLSNQAVRKKTKRSRLYYVGYSFTLGVIGLATRSRRRRTARAATGHGQGHVARQRDRLRRRYGGQIAYFRFYRTGSSIARTDFGAWTDRRSITGDWAAARAEIPRKASSRERWRPNRK